MLPAPLQFELLPRQPSLVRRLALIALVLASAAGAAVVWSQGQSARDEVGRQLAQARAGAAGHAASATAPNLPTVSSQETQDEALRELTVEQRLLEIERCTDATTIVTRLTHDEAAKVTTVELDVVAADRLAVLLECLNAAQGQAHAWRLGTVQALPGQGAASGVQRATLRR
jgi:hypothetical protein